MRRHREQRGNKIRRNELDMKEEGKGKKAERRTAGRTLNQEEKNRKKKMFKQKLNK